MGNFFLNFTFPFENRPPFFNISVKVFKEFSDENEQKFLENFLMKILEESLKILNDHRKNQYSFKGWVKSMYFSRLPEAGKMII